MAASGSAIQSNILALFAEASLFSWLRKRILLSLRHELRQMIAQGRGAAIVTAGSIVGLMGLAGIAAPLASKRAVYGMTGNAAVDYAPHAFRVNSVKTGTTGTLRIAGAGTFAAAANAAPGPRPRVG